MSAASWIRPLAVTKTARWLLQWVTRFPGRWADSGVRPAGGGCLRTRARCAPRRLRSWPAACRRRLPDPNRARPPKSGQRELAADVLDDLAVLGLRAEHDQLGVGVDPHAVASRPVEEVAGGATLAAALLVVALPDPALPVLAVGVTVVVTAAAAGRSVSAEFVPLVFGVLAMALAVLISARPLHACWRGRNNARRGHPQRGNLRGPRAAAAGAPPPPRAARAGGTAPPLPATRASPNRSGCPAARTCGTWQSCYSSCSTAAPRSRSRRW